MIANLRVAGKLACAFALLIAAFIGVSGVVWHAKEAVQEASTQNRRSGKILDRILHGKTMMIQASAALEGFITTQDEALAAEYDRAKSSFDSDVKQFLALAKHRSLSR